MKGKETRKTRRQNERKSKKQQKQAHFKQFKSHGQSDQRLKTTSNSAAPSFPKKRHFDSSSQASSKKLKSGVQNKFMEMIQEQVDEGIIDVSSSKLKTTGSKKYLSVEDQALKRLEANLGIGKANGKDRLKQEFAKDGLGEDFGDFLLGLDDLSKRIQDSEADEASDEGNSSIDGSESEMDEETRKEMELLAQEDATFMQGFDDLPTDDEEEEDDLAQFETEDEEEGDDSEVQKNTLMNQNRGQVDSDESEAENSEAENDNTENKSEDEESDEDSSQNEKPTTDQANTTEAVEEDIYGRPKIPSTGSSRYVPPHLRSIGSSNDELLREIRRRVNGQLNRLAESNMESIDLEFESIYRAHVRSDVNRVLLDALLATCCHETQIMHQLITISSALLGALFHSVGTEIVGFFIENFVKRFHEEIKKLHDSKEISDEDITSKATTNLLLMITNLYTFETVHCTLVYDIFRFLIESFKPIDVELLHILLQHCGPSLRADDPTALADMVTAVQSKASAHEEKRTQFLLDLIANLKKSKSKTKGSGAFSSDRYVQLKKWIGRVKSRVGHSNNALRVSFSELINADAQGRWWIIGGTWVPQNRSTKSESEEANQNALLRLAEKQRMNTDVRRSIFCAIMGASDCIEAYDAVLKLGLKDKQEREIIRVIIHCCGQEAKYNPYYALLASKFAASDPKFKFTLQLAYWDCFKQVLDFTDLSPSAVLLLKVTFERILLIDDDNALMEIFERLSQHNTQVSATRDGITVFLHQHMINAKLKDPKGKTRVKKAIRMLESMGKS
ncbi:hypothetical protein AeRB84_002530 [Aphanomyces euteiches]|nr:hypothetical protein AeRB84_002530 [Aphanomyces euteiches]